MMGHEHPRPGPEPWRDLAGCRGADPAIFFMEVGEDATAAHNICSACPVRTDCLEHALASQEQHGIWGGLVPRELRAERRRRRRNQLKAERAAAA